MTKVFVASDEQQHANEQQTIEARTTRLAPTALDAHVFGGATLRLRRVFTRRQWVDAATFLANLVTAAIVLTGFDARAAFVARITVSAIGAEATERQTIRAARLS